MLVMLRSTSTGSTSPMAQAKKKKGKKKVGPRHKLNPTCKLTKDVMDKFVKIVGEGNFRQTACQMLGIKRWTYCSWIAAGNKQLRDYADGKRKNILIQGQFVQALEKAEAEAHISVLKDVKNSSDVKAKMWYLSRRYNKQYSLNPNAHLDDETGEEVKADTGMAIFERLVAALKEES